MSSTDVLAPISSATAPPAARAAVADGDLTAEVAMRWACAPRRWRDAVQHVPGERWYLRLFEDERVCGWLITWAPGTTLELHDHGGAVGSLAVVEGVLQERFRDRRRVEPFARRELTAGSMVTFTADHVHEVTNTGDVPAVSIHVYAPSLDEMTFYEEEPNAAGIRATRAEAVEAVRAPLSATVAGAGGGSIASTPTTPSADGSSRAVRSLGPSSTAPAASATRPASLAAAWLQGFR